MKTPKSTPVNPGLKRIVFCVLPPVREIDLLGAMDVFASANRLSPKGALYQLTVLSATASAERRIEGMSGVWLSYDSDLRSFRGEIDTLLVPGGLGVEQAPPTASAVRWLVKASERSRRVGSICTGAFALAHAGLLDGRRATTHWAFADELARKYRAVKVDPDPIWVQDGKFYTSAGVTSGIDLALALLEEDQGAALALEVARLLVVFLRRPGSQAQFSVSLRGQATERKPLHELRLWMAEHLAADLSVPALARRAVMSRRNFERVFAKSTGKSPARYVEELRIETARRMVERSRRSLDEVADQCGFASVDVLRRTFLRVLKTTPGEYRRRFASSGIGE